MPKPWVPPPTSEASAQSGRQTHLSGVSSNTGQQDDEWNKTSGIVSKPLHGWLHPDQKLADNGICYGVRYIGCLEVNTSMKMLDFDTRSQIAKECINRVCEAAGLKTADKKRRVDKRLSRMLAEKPNMDFAGSNVSLTVTSSSLNLVAMESGEVIANHEMPNISFASGGDADTLDFVSYVAKDHCYGRACFVLECGGGLAQDVITTIGQAFELRYKQFIKRNVPTSRNENELGQPVRNGNIPPLREDPDYYNDLPGKVPPDIPIVTPPNSNALSSSTVCQNAVPGTSAKEINRNLHSLPVAYATTPLKKEAPDSLIDFNADFTNVASYRKPEPEYVNTSAVTSHERPLEETAFAVDPNTKHDIFDMQPFSTSLSSIQLPDTLAPKTVGSDPHVNSVGNLVPTANPNNNASSVHSMRTELMKEEWFHGTISRKDSESLVIRDGDFLVRESQGCPGQFILTGMQGGLRKHLLLVDPEGLIRTKDQVFENVSHLIRYHKDNCLPIISAESALLLRTPIFRPRPIGKSIQV